MASLGNYNSTHTGAEADNSIDKAQTAVQQSQVSQTLEDDDTKVPSLSLTKRIYDQIADKTYNFDSLTELITWQDSLETAGVYYGILEEKDVFRYIVEITSTGNIRQVREQFTTSGTSYGYDFPAAIIQQRTFASGTGSGVSWSQVLAEQPNVYNGDWDLLEKPGIYFAPTFLNGRYDMTYLQVGQRIGDPLDTKIYQIAFSWHPQREVVYWAFREFEPGMGSGVAWSEKWLAETPLQVSGAPTTATKGYYIGQLCVNTTTSDTYILLGWNGENSYTSTEFTWVQVAFGSYLPLAGGTMTGNINMGSHSLTYVSSITDSSNIESPLNRYYDITGLTVDLNADYLPSYNFKGEYILQCKSTSGGSAITNSVNTAGNFKLIRKVIRSGSSSDYTIFDTYIDVSSSIVVYTRRGYYTGTWTWSTWYANFTTQAGSSYPLTDTLYGKGYLPTTSNAYDFGGDSNYIRYVYAYRIYFDGAANIRGNSSGGLILSGNTATGLIYMRPNGFATTTGITLSNSAFRPEVAQGITLGDATYPFGATHHGALSIYDSTGALTNEIKAPLASLYNTFVGVGTPISATGSGNTAFGYASLQSLTTGTYNTAIGQNALRHITGVNRNVALGQNAGRYYNGSTGNNNTSSVNSIFIGAETSPLADGASNEIVIGDGAIGHGSNTATIGNTSITECWAGSTNLLATATTTYKGLMSATDKVKLDNISSDSGWINLTLLNSVTAVSGLTPQYRKIGNTVYLRGAITNTLTSPLTFSSLPSGYRPTIEHLFYAVDKSQATPPVSISIDTSGNVVAVNGDADSTYNFYISTSFLID